MKCWTLCAPHVQRGRFPLHFGQPLGGIGGFQTGGRRRHDDRLQERVRAELLEWWQAPAGPWAAPGRTDWFLGVASKAWSDGQGWSPCRTDMAELQGAQVARVMVFPQALLYNGRGIAGMGVGGYDCQLPMVSLCRGLGAIRAPECSRTTSLKRSMPA